MNEFPIRMLSELTGVPPTTLRAWERRYGLLKPVRTPKGHRVYSENDLETVRKVVRLLGQNHTISKAINLVRQGESTPQTEPVEQTHWIEYRKRLLRSIERFDDIKLDGIYNEALSFYPIDLVTSNLLRPLLVDLGERWQDKQAGIAEEHFFTAYLRNKIGARIHHAGQGFRRRLMLAGLPGEYHELGALLFALSAMARGYRILYLGIDLPLDQVVSVTERVDIDGVILSGSRMTVDEKLLSELDVLAEKLPVPLMLGGSVSCTLDRVNRQRPGLVDLGADTVVALQRLEQCVPARHG